MMNLDSNVSGTTFTRAPAATDKYVQELDGIRAIAIAFVVTAHYQLIPVSVPGGFGVTLFFFLSGYLITTLFFSEYQATRSIVIPLFYLRRWIRLTPPLVIMVTISIIFFRVTRVGVDGTSIPFGTTMAGLFYYTNYYDLAWGMDPYKVIPFGVCWSLAIEEHFYLLWPLVIKLFIKSPGKLVVGIAVACASVLVWRGIALWGLGLSVEYTEYATDTRIDSILYGVLLRVLFESPWRAVAISTLMNRAVQILGILVLLLCFAIRNEGFRQTIRYSLQGLALMPVFTTVLLERPDNLSRKLLSAPPMVLIGRLSYSIYLFHLPARTPGEVIFGSPYNIGTKISGLIITGIVAYTLLIFVELPLGKLRHRLRRRESRINPLAAAKPLNP
jgi:peptidoglycan/LPS O-acetylase OafA/YrhL